MSVPTHGPNCMTLSCNPTRCNRCGKIVFYYECTCGSKVFFDAIGDPWPKHICSGSGLFPQAGEHITFKDTTIYQPYSYSEIQKQFNEQNQTKRVHCPICNGLLRYNTFTKHLLKAHNTSISLEQDR